MFRASLALGCVLGAGISVALLVIGLSGKGGKDDRQATTSSSADTRGHALEDWSARPARLTRYPLPGYAVSPEFRRFLLEQVVLYGRAKGMAEPAVAVHALRLRDKVLEMKGFGGKAFFEKTLRLIVDDREYRKAGRPFPILMDTAYGAGFRTQANARQGIRITNAALAGGMTHVDKVLSTLGELGIPLDYRLVTETDREYPLAAVLEDSMQRFHLKRELEWSVNAYCDYLGNQQSWRNSRGEEFSFDDVAQALLDRRISDSPCFGTHWVYAVAKICVRWRRAPGCIRSESGQRVEGQLRRVAQCLVRTQGKDGSWGSDWYAPLEPSEAKIEPPPSVVVEDFRTKAENKLRATGHLLEWMAIVPSDLRPPDRVIRGAVGYLERVLRADPEFYFNQEYAPTTHAVRALLDLSSPGSEPAAPTRGPKTTFTESIHHEMPRAK